MNWEEVGAIGQVLGSVAVLVTLGYLAVQVRHSRTALLGSITLTQAAMILDQSMAGASDEGLVHLIVKAETAFGGVNHPFVDEMVKRAGLTVEEARRVYGYQAAWWQIRSESIRYMKELPDSDQEGFDARMRLIFRAGSLDRFWYETNKPIVTPDAVRYMDNLLAQPG